MANRALSYYMKGLSMEVRQRLFSFLRNDISATMTRWFLEKPDDYPSLRSCGFSDSDIQAIAATYAERFRLANQVMAENGRPPLFADLDDSYRCAQEYTELMKLRPDEELAALFGCARVVDCERYGRTRAMVHVSPSGHVNTPIAYWWPSCSQKDVSTTRPEPVASSTPASNVPEKMELGVASSRPSPVEPSCT